jgi:hypothetical protein
VKDGIGGVEQLALLRGPAVLCCLAERERKWAMWLPVSGAGGVPDLADASYPANSNATS